METKSQVITESTEKRWKKLQVIAWFLAFPGVVAVIFGAAGHDALPRFWHYLLIAGGIGLFLSGFGLHSYARFMAWWHHG